MALVMKVDGRACKRTVAHTALIIYRNCWRIHGIGRRVCIHRQRQALSSRALRRYACSLHKSTISDRFALRTSRLSPNKRHAQMTQKKPRLNNRTDGRHSCSQFQFDVKKTKPVFALAVHNHSALPLLKVIFDARRSMWWCIT